MKTKEIERLIDAGDKCANASMVLHDNYKVFGNLENAEVCKRMFAEWEEAKKSLENNEPVKLLSELEFMKSKLPLKYKLYCEFLVSRFFASMFDMEERKHWLTFSWANFPELAPKYVMMNIWLVLPYAPKKKKQILEYAKYVAISLLEESKMKDEK